MAKRPFTLKAADKPNELINQGWPEKTALEVWKFGVSVRSWLKLLETTHGQIVEMFAHDNGDDPPDVFVRFENDSFGFEMTELIPEKFAKFDHVVRDLRKTNCTVSPSLSGPELKTKKAMANYAVSIHTGGGWTHSGKETAAWVIEASNKFAVKAAKAGKATFRYLVMFADSSHINSHEVEAVLSNLNQTIQGRAEDFPSLILFRWTNPYQYESWVLRKGTDVLSITSPPQ